MGFPAHRTQNSLRFSLGLFSTEAEVDSGRRRAAATGREAARLDAAELVRTGGREPQLNRRCASSSRCRAAWTRRWPRPCSPSRVTTSSACRCSSTTSRTATGRRWRVRQLLLARRPAGRTPGRRRDRHPALHPRTSSEQFDDLVVSNFVREYAAGRTPLPCAHCNSDLKFATLAERAAGFGADAVATGHYARVERDAATGRYLPEARARRVEGPGVLSLLPDAGAARARAASRSATARRTKCASTRGACGLAVADKPDSQEICFIPDHDYAAFVEPRGAGSRARRADRGRAGTHARHPRRHPPIHRRPAEGPGTGGGAQTDGPLYVLQLQPSTGDVVVGPRASLERTTLSASGVNWITPPPGPRAASSPRRSATVTTPAPATVRATGRDVGRRGVRRAATGHHARTGRGVL